MREGSTNMRASIKSTLMYDISCPMLLHACDATYSPNLQDCTGKQRRRPSIHPATRGNCYSIDYLTFPKGNSSVYPVTLNLPSACGPRLARHQLYLKIDDRRIIYQLPQAQAKSTVYSHLGKQVMEHGRISSSKDLDFMPFVGKMDTPSLQP